MSGAVEPVGEVEIAERLGVLPSTVHQWVYRRRLPAPRWTVSGRPAWDWADVEAWARATNRLPGEVALDVVLAAAAERLERIVDELLDLSLVPPHRLELEAQRDALDAAIVALTR